MAESVAMSTGVAPSWMTLKRLHGRKNKPDWINGTRGMAMLPTGEHDGPGARIAS
eukprot:COSAG05_NODE_16150_length_352_cov_1.525692_1_plen_54_part_10